MVAGLSKDGSESVADMDASRIRLTADQVTNSNLHPGSWILNSGRGTTRLTHLYLSLPIVFSLTKAKRYESC
jgi:hypothetical protein